MIFEVSDLTSPVIGNGKRVLQKWSVDQPKRKRILQKRGLNKSKKNAYMPVSTIKAIFIKALSVEGHYYFANPPETHC